MVENTGTLPEALSRSYPAQSVHAGSTSTHTASAAAARRLPLVNEHLLRAGLGHDALHVSVAVPGSVGKDAEDAGGERRMVQGRLGRSDVGQPTQHEEPRHRAERAEEDGEL